MTVLFLIWRETFMFSIVATPIYIPTQGFPFLHILANT